QDRRTAAIEVLDELVAAHPTHVPSLLARAKALEDGDDRDRTIEAYRTVLAQEPENVMALNNLAYLLLESSDGAAEGVAMARRAFELSRGAGLVADTLGWGLFITGD